MFGELRWGRGQFFDALSQEQFFFSPLLNMNTGIAENQLVVSRFKGVLRSHPELSTFSLMR